MLFINQLKSIKNNQLKINYKLLHFWTAFFSTFTSRIPEISTNHLSGSFNIIQISLNVFGLNLDKKIRTLVIAPPPPRLIVISKEKYNRSLNYIQKRLRSVK